MSQESAILGAVKSYRVASGLVFDASSLLFVQNRRRNGSLDWSTPGGIVDEGEEVLEALSREVVEETSLVVHQWSSCIYQVLVDFPDREMTLDAQIFQAEQWSGTLRVDDPDDVVVDGRFAMADAWGPLIEQSPRWVGEPLMAELTRRRSQPDPSVALVLPPDRWRFTVTGDLRNPTIDVLERPLLP